VGALTFAGFGFVGWKVFLGGSQGSHTALGDAPVMDALGGNTAQLGMKLFSDYLWPFELASVVILLALVAAVMIGRGAKKERES
jgi:NADH-quinone oxidoreductase subunit J